jgi:chemotaxis protein methyltransferase CheR
MDDADFGRFRTLIQQQTGICLRDGKQVMLASRLGRRLRHHGLTSFSEYLALVERRTDGDKEMGEFINCITTNKTSFFRESHHFDFLAETLVPAIKQSAARGAAKSMRIWCAASSTGEEPYSIVISLLEAFGPIAAGWDIKVVASDIDTEVLRKAAAGIYSVESLDTMNESMKSRYFLRGKGDATGQVKVKAEVAAHIQFKRINLMEPVWPVEGLFDAIFFRNALIYFAPPTQSLFLRRMLRSLKPNGYLFLGHSEHVPWLHDAVKPLSKTIYQLRTSPLTAAVHEQVLECR